MAPQRPGLQRWLPAILIGLPLLILLAGGWLAWQSTWRRAATELQHSADAAAELALRVLQGQQLMVERLNDLLRGLSDTEIRTREPALHASFAAMMASLPQVVTGYALDRDGVPLVSANILPVPRDMRFTDRDFFAALQAPDAPQTFVGQVYRGRVDGALFFVVAQRRHGTGNPAPADGFDGIASVSVDPKALSAGLARLLAAPEDVMAIMRADGNFLVRVPPLEEPAPPLGAASLLRTAMQDGAASGLSGGRSSVDGVWRLTAYRRLEGWPVYALAGRSRGAILLDWAGLMALQLAVGAPALLALFAFGRLAAERARREADARVALAAATVRQAAAGALRDSEARYRTLSEVAADVVWMRHADGAMPAPQPSWEAFTGQSPSQYRGFGWREAIHPEDREAATTGWEAATRTGKAYDAEIRLRHRDGGWRHCLTRAAPVPVGPPEPGAGSPADAASRDAPPAAIWVGAHIDVTPLREAETQQRFLMQEIDHRAKNALAVVQAVMRLTRAPSQPAFVAAVEGRVAALARAQTVLAEGRWAGAELRVLLDAELAAFRVAPSPSTGASPGISAEADGRPAVTLDGPAVSIRPVAAQPLSMAMHELATNAVKHGALATPGGRVSVDWQVDAVAGLLRLRWTEAGGPAVVAPQQRGFGSRVLDTTLRQQLGGEARMEWRPEGLVCSIELPLQRVIRHGPPPP
ncbi:MAG: Two-component sensor histidine kinase, contains HisKA and HATPase domain [Belnapia sp.]|nr:Two-component sensor histidine kinase, contains HisKA and HATPase domain [Belnapia sp.]